MIFITSVYYLHSNPAIEIYTYLSPDTNTFSAFSSTLFLSLSFSHSLLSFRFSSVSFITLWFSSWMVFFPVIRKSMLTSNVFEILYSCSACLQELSALSVLLIELWVKSAFCDSRYAVNPKSFISFTILSDILFMIF